MPIKIVPKNDGMDEDQELDQFGGFGREAVEEAAKRPTYASTQGQVDDRDRREAAVAGPLKKPAPVKKPAPDKKEAPKAEAPKTEAPVKKEAPKTEARKPGRSAVANRKRGKSDAETTTVKVAPGATAVERMRNTMKQRFGEKNKYGMKKGGMVSSASKRADGIAIKGKTRGKMV
jgi:outer membrane biosynthesis protein TonB